MEGDSGELHPHDSARTPAITPITRALDTFCSARSLAACRWDRARSGRGLRVGRGRCEAACRRRTAAAPAATTGGRIEKGVVNPRLEAPALRRLDVGVLVMT